MAVNDLVRIERLRSLLDNASGEAFLPPGWQKLVGALHPLLEIAEAAHELVGVTTHANVSGVEYAERKLMYAKVRDRLARL